ncbi:MAG: queuosine salvage family protein [Myxococcota bacterium]
MSLFDRVRRAARAVSERARFVRIDHSALETLSHRLLAAGEEPPKLDPARHHRGSSSSTLAFIFTLNAVNFGSGWFPKLRKRPGCSGYFTVAHCLKDRFDASGPWRAEELRALRGEDCAAIFEQDAASRDVAELMGLFAQSLADLGRWLELRFGGRFEALAEAAADSAERLVTLLLEMPFYRDVSRYAELEVPFYKRAQLAAADLCAGFGGTGFGNFHDLDALTLFADNLVPHVLRHEGVLVYDRALSEQIDAEQPLRAGSPEEVEIRAVALHAVEGLVDAIRARGAHTSARQLDYVLWRRGHSKQMKARPRHRARTVYY